MAKFRKIDVNMTFVLKNLILLIFKDFKKKKKKKKKKKLKKK